MLRIFNMHFAGESDSETVSKIGWELTDLQPCVWRSCTSDYWQIAYLHLQVRKNAQER